MPLVLTCLLIGGPIEGGQKTSDRILDPDTVDLRGIWGGKLNEKKARERGLDPARLHLPRKIRDVPPRYPAEAMERRLGGRVDLDCIITTTGAVEDCRALTAHKLLRQAALDAVHRWLFEPLRVDGVPRQAAVSLMVSFSVS